MSPAALMLLAWLIEAMLGWPRWLFARIRHPVVWIGALISQLDHGWNRRDHSSAIQKLLGGFAALVVISVTILVAVTISWLLPNTLLGFLAEAAIASSLLASRSLYQHVAAVAHSLSADDLAGARNAVSQIVGRDPAQLDEPAIARAAIESLAENTSDGVVAPLFWGVLFGLPGIAAYKALNTLDSMIGHMSTRHRNFGWASARLDDLVNLIPARLTAIAFAVAGCSVRAVKVAVRDAQLHRSPNAGWPESAMAGSIGVRLSGPRSYAGHQTDEPWVNGECPDPDDCSIWLGLRLFVTAMVIVSLFIAVIALARVIS
ncbi:MAG: adenosylcobinamide-phosphate synthase CbiB [Pseudomonadota bacterium]